MMDYVCAYVRRKPHCSCDVGNQLSTLALTSNLVNRVPPSYVGPAVTLAGQENPHNLCSQTVFLRIHEEIFSFTSFCVLSSVQECNLVILITFDK